MTIYIGDSETNGLLHEVTKFHCVCFSPTDNNKFFIFCDMEELSNFNQESFCSKNVDPLFFPLNDYVKLIDSPKTTGIVFHNLLGYDLPVFKKLSGVTYDVESINNRDLKLIDTLVMSQYLWPDRSIPKGCKGAHGLEAWGVRTGVSKPMVVDWKDQPLDVYLHRVIEDVRINKEAYFLLLKEAKDVAASNGNKKGDWGGPLSMAHKVRYLMCKQEETGVGFDIKAAQNLVESVKKEMQDIEELVEKDLGERELPGNQQPNFPRNPFKKPFDYKAPFTQRGLKKPVSDYLSRIDVPLDQQKEFICCMLEKETIDGVSIIHNHIEKELPQHYSLLSSAAITYCNKFGITDPQEQLNEILRVQKGGETRRLREKLKLKHKKDVKSFLVTKGNWVPTMFKYRNILVSPKTKEKLTTQEVSKKLDSYLKEFTNGPYWSFILEDLGYRITNVNTESDSFRNKCIKKGRALLSAPQYKDTRGVLCPNFEKVTGATSKKIIRWLALQNRLNTICSDNGTGWLHHERLKIDSRLPARSSGITPTFRQKHSVICNVPKPSDSVVLGKEMRGLFVPRKGYYQIGCDACGIQQRCGAHYAAYFDDGEYANEIIDGDTHQKNAEAYTDAAQHEITRSQGKNLSYAILFGATGKKIAKMASVNEIVGDRLVEGFWEANKGIAKAKEAMEVYWEKTGKKYIYGIDGRKVFVRAKYSIFNFACQSAEAILMDWAACYIDMKVKREGIDFYRTLFVHDEYGGEHNQNEVQVLMSKEEPEQFRDGKLYSKPIKNDDGYTQYYSRAGEIIAMGIQGAGEFYKMNLPFPGEYLCSLESWACTH